MPENTLISEFVQLPFAQKQQKVMFLCNKYNNNDVLEYVQHLPVDSDDALVQVYTSLIDSSKFVTSWTKITHIIEKAAQKLKFFVRQIAEAEERDSADLLLDQI